MNRKLLPLLIIFSGLWGSLSAGHLSSNLLFTARMSGENEVPAVLTNGQGIGIFTFDEKKSTLYINVSLSNLSGPITGIHVHEAEIGANGPVIYNLTPFLQGNRLKGTIQNITRESFAKFISGDYYINAHTDMHPGGEIRGQIELETDYRFTALLSGANEVPAVSTNGKGLFVANLSHGGDLVKFHMVFEGLSSDVTGAHIHMAAAGVIGPVIFDLGASLFGNIVTGTWDPTGFLDELRAGELYVNVHTVNNPGGEIRGQLVLEEGLMFDAVLDGDQEFPSVDTKGTGVAMFTVSPDMTTLNYYVISDSLSGEITGAHFHAGAAGTNGGVVVDLSDDINGNVISGSVPMTVDLLNMLLEGNIYINLHTDENPGGEIRGQVYKLAREGYIFDMNGGQEVPPASTTATGAGMVSIDRDQTNAHYMIVYSGLQGVFTGAHFHNGAPGENGGVIIDITGSFNLFGGAFDHVTIDAATSLMFREHEMYVNVHSTLFPAGEIRGNVIRAAELFTEKPFDPGFGNNFMLFAEMDGDSEVPAVTTDAKGLATFYIGADRDEVQINVTVNGLSGPITGAHIHEGFFGENGPVVFPLFYEGGNRIHTTLDGITREQLGKFISGNYYINVHTAENPGGEIRGQINLDQDATFIAVLSGNQENPPVATDARGLGAFHFILHELKLDVNVQLTELSSEITGVHLHQGFSGENGPVIVDLGSLIDGNRLQGQVELDIFDLISLVIGNVYINVHTTNHPGGEIRGQLSLMEGLVFDGWMSGLQEVPFAVTSASGLAIANVTSELDSVQFWMVSDGLSGPAGQAHFHMAKVGSNGSVVLDLSSGLINDDIYFNGPVTDAVVSALLSGSIYANVHTPAFPGGEIRGQLFRLARGGYGFDMCPEQETAAVNAPGASGSGLVSIDRLHTNANIAAMTTGLTGPITGSHIHRAPIGMNGPVIEPLPFEDGGIFAYGFPLDTGVINAILSGNTYMNVHTAMHPGGEIRGQIIQDLICGLPVGLNELEYIVADVTLSPVPVTDILNINIDALANTNLSMNVIDISGKLLSRSEFNVTEGRNTLQVDTDILSPGFYMLVISDGKAAQAYKFIK